MVTIQPIYSPIIFIGRERELSVMTNLLHTDVHDSTSKWILSVHGQGGIGKTQLLHQFAKVAKAHQHEEENHGVMVTHHPIDLYLTSNQTEVGILKSLADQLSQEHFQEFYTTLYESYQHSGDEEDLRTIFLECYSRLDTDHIVLLFDTIEQCSDAAKRFFRKLLPKLKHGGKGKFGTLVIVAGRQSLTDFLIDEGIQDHPLQGLTKAEIEKYFKSLLLVNQQIKPEFVDRVTKLSQGRPIMIALTVDWLNYGNLPDDFSVQTPEEFEKLMIEQIQELRTPEDQTILAMAQFYRRFDEDFLRVILEFPENQAHEMIQSLARFSFVKTHYTEDGKIDSCLLHDEMQRLVMSYVWNCYDPEGDLRQEWSAKAVNYYNELIARVSNTEQNLAFCQTLERERLFYGLQADIKKGLNDWRRLYNKARLPYEKEAINEEVQAFERKLSVEEKLELKFRRALTAYDQNEYRTALKAFENILERASDDTLKAEIYPMMIYCLTHLGEIERSLKLGAESKTWFQSIVEKEYLALEVQHKFQHAYSKTMNAIGYAHRNQSRYEQAIEYYEKALEILNKLSEPDADRASIKTNLAYLFHSMGRDREALAHGKTALKIAERFDNLRQLGLTHNVLGIISANSAREHQAMNHFNQALNYFKETEDQRGLALVKIAVGRMYRQIGWSKVKPNRQEFESASQNYAKAAKMLDEAIAHVRQSSRSILIDAYNEKATLLREQSCFSEAIDLYEKSQKIAKSIDSRIKIANNLLDLGVTYELQNKLEDALHDVEEATKIAKELNSPQLLSRAQRTIANVLLKQGDYDRAIDNAIDSCIKVLEPDRHSFKNSPAKRDALREEWLTWLTEDIIQNLPTTALKKAKCQYLIQRWESAEVVGKDLAEHYPGFVITLEYLITETD